MQTLIVLRWPERSAALVEKRFRSTTIREELPAVEDKFPETWLDEADEVRVVVGRDVLYRSLELPGVAAAELATAARFAAEPLLPVPIEEMTIALADHRRRGAGRVLLSAIAASRLDEIVKTVKSMTERPEADAAVPPITWLGPALGCRRPEPAVALRAAHWAAVAAAGTWLDVQSAPNGTLAVEALQRRHAAETWDWREAGPSDDYLAVASAPARLAWNIAPPRRREKIVRHWPVLLVLASLALVAASFGLRVHAAQSRLASADKRMTAVFTETLPGTRVVAPADQMRARAGEARLMHDALRSRMGKTGSALAVLAALEKAVDPSEALIEDLKITATDFRVSGSGVSVEAVQKTAESLRAALKETDGDAATVANPDIRRSGGGLGFDFTIEGKRR